MDPVTIAALITALMPVILQLLTQLIQLLQHITPLPVAAAGAHA
jgi:hypothetical protein